MCRDSAALSWKEESLLQFGSASSSQSFCLCFQGKESQAAHYENSKICKLILSIISPWITSHPLMFTCSALSCGSLE